MYRLRHSPAEVAHALLAVMHRGSLRAAEKVTGHKYETIARWLYRAGAHVQGIAEILTRDLHLNEEEVDAFWSFVKKAPNLFKRGQARRAGWPTLGSSSSP